jgi:hypothetical protein
VAIDKNGKTTSRPILKEKLGTGVNGSDDLPAKQGTLNRQPELP